MERRYFGTDGIRGRVGRAPMTPDFALRLGWAAGRVLVNGSHAPVIIGKDTRVSGYMFESALEAGLSAAGADIRLLGPMPTPAIAYLTRTFRAAAGIVISASHNPFFDNGFKFFSAEGTKLPDEVELAIEAQLDRPVETVDSADIGKVERVHDAAGRYIEFCKGSIPGGTAFHDTTVVVDCAHGATYAVAPSVFEELGADVIAIGNEPDGFNINEDAGSLHPETLRAAVLTHQAHVGIALDGDGDRVLMVDEKGELLDGDELLCILALGRAREGLLHGGVVGTLMSNLGLEIALGEQGIAFRRAAVGDRHVLEMMHEEGWKLGGESSGHIICLDRTTTGDGIVAALQVLHIMHMTGQSLSELRKNMTKFPQTLINVPLNGSVDRRGVLEAGSVMAAVRMAEQQLGAQGRVLLRSSGTEPLMRVMVEGREERRVQDIARDIAEAVREVAGQED